NPLNRSRVCRAGRGGADAWKPDPLELERQAKAQFQSIDVIAEREVIAARVQLQCDNERNEHERRHRTSAAIGARVHVLHDAHLSAQQQSPHERTEDSKVEPHLAEETRRNVFIKWTGERLRAESHDAGRQFAQPAMARWNLAQYRQEM